VLHLFHTAQHGGADAARIDQVAPDQFGRPGDDHFVAAGGANQSGRFGRRGGAQDGDVAIASGAGLDSTGHDGGQRPTPDQNDRIGNRIAIGAVETDADQHESGGHQQYRQVRRLQNQHECGNGGQGGRHRDREPVFGERLTAAPSRCGPDHGTDELRHARVPFRSSRTGDDRFGVPVKKLV
jgi:hypothetical protein